MSQATLNAVHDAIAAHVADEADGIELLTEWVAIAAAAMGDDHSKTMYYKINLSTPYHHTLGLLERGMEMLQGGED